MHKKVWKFPSKGLSINDVILLIDLLRTEYTLLYSVQVYKKDDITAPSTLILLIAPTSL